MLEKCSADAEPILYQEYLRICTLRQNEQRITKEEYELASRVAKAGTQLDYVKRNRGLRYAQCDFENYTITTAKQKVAIDKLQAYAANCESEITAGRNVILFGAKGTGKDHLMMALCRQCVKTSAPMIHWRNGPHLFDQWRSEVSGRGFETQWSNVNERDSDVLMLSDPIPIGGGLTDYIQSKLFELIDFRYSHQKPVWITANVSDSNELSERIGSQTADRLRHECLPIYCDWHSFRTGE